MYLFELTFREGLTRTVVAPRFEEALIEARRLQSDELNGYNLNNIEKIKQVDSLVLDGKVTEYMEVQS